ncbi:hypothetical protein [Methanonatronarchaeum sp. AMET6-2]|uniref:hypothetical protein n=1 Tax=Methanonatronarchaeum sp. AMET6-2 TaxID=2933293 RepID=UPI0011FC8972|nr:hypothetical protein [Methanonatronarchaeum sp. AMET6-2]RZN62664.1 MAG: hypothetical protein EF811_02315 [Methanonatronarchaeia archaeon]UOY10329.1 hypothetical protein MU439_01475 [Methanonatronarchaeum sp. AMET6-2]
MGSDRCHVCGRDSSDARECIVCEETVCSNHYRFFMGVCTDCAPEEEAVDGGQKIDKTVK